MNFPIPSKVFKFIMQLSLCFIIPLGFVMAEGSIDLIKYPGKRLFLNAQQAQQLKVFAKKGEYINFGSSHIGIAGGFVKIFKPDGSIYATYDNTGSTAGLAIIYNSTQEKNGPTGGGTLNGQGYNPGIIAVPDTEEGVWTFVFGYPSYNQTVFKNLDNADPWTRALDQPTNQRVVLSWDITVSKNSPANNGGTMLKGRVYSNEYNSIVNENANFTSPKFFVLNNNGYLYEVEFYDTDPWGFPLCSNNLGIVDGKGDPIYKSLKQVDYIRSDNPSNWTQESKYLFEPQAQDFGPFINNKIFFNIPDHELPESALVTDIARNNTHTTWLLNPLTTFGPSFLEYKFKPGSGTSSSCPPGFYNEGDGGNFIFTINTSGSIILSLDLDNDGNFDGPLDKTYFKVVKEGSDTIHWDGKFGNGQLVTEQQNYTLAYKAILRTGEIHILMNDIENNPGGVTITRLNGPNNPVNQFYYDHSSIGANVSGGGTPGNPKPTSIPFKYSNNFGNEKMLDYWSYVDVNVTGAASYDIFKDCSHHYPDSDGDGIPDNIDLDDDNDGIADYLEYCNNGIAFSCLPGGKDPSHDEDGDFILNYMDADDPAVNNNCPDANLDGICDFILPVYDTDGDGIPNHLDLDSDNDGIPDIDESGYIVPDVNRNGTIDFSPGVFGTNGFYTPLSTDPNSPNAKAINQPRDKDNDGIPDFVDRDADNDGIFDVAEAGYSLFDGDDNGALDDGTGNTPSANINGLLPYIDPAFTGKGILRPVDTDLDSIPDYNDLDSDNDGINDVAEASNIDPDNDGFIGTSKIIVDKFGMPIGDITGKIYKSTSHATDSDSDNLKDYLDLDSDGDGIYDCSESGFTDGDHNGIVGISPIIVNALGQPIKDVNNTVLINTSSPRDQDEDGVEDYRDLDRDGDMIADILECPNAISCPDTDGDGVPDIDDLDSDNDGIFDISEYGFGTEDNNNDGLYDGNTSIPKLIGSNGFPKIIDPLLTGNAYPLRPDHDLDGVPDFLDRDSDNDGINDVAENGAKDDDNDGEIGKSPIIVNSKGIAIKDVNNKDLISTSVLKDKDKDTVANIFDLDSDNDGNPDVSEALLPDPDGDAQIGNKAFKIVNSFGQTLNPSGVNVCISLLPDSDNDGVSDLYDVDSDNDGILDIVENGNATLDSNHDGMIDDGAGNFPQVGENGFADILDPTITGILLPQTKDADLDNIPDYRDLDSDNDGINDDLEALYTDSDGDGYIGTSPLIVNECGAVVKDAKNVIISYNFIPNDNDGDGIPNYLDLDSDGDGIKDVIEAGLIDPDDNGFPGNGNVFVNPNGQPLLDISGNLLVQATKPWDHDKDNVPDFLDLDADGDGIFDRYECPTGVPCPDKDADGVADIYDLDSDNDGISDLAENGLSNYDGNHDGIMDDGNGNPGIIDAHGIPDFLNVLILAGTKTSAKDTDSDGVPDYNDLDSDNDGINDVGESNLSDPDNDGIIGTGAVIVNSSGQPIKDANGNTIIIATQPLDSDGDGLLNQTDLDSDGDGILDTHEAGIKDPDNDGIAGSGTPTVNMNGQPVKDANGDLITWTSNPPDFDGDGLADMLDIDSDNDGIDDGTECPAGFPCPDTDGDGIIDGHDLDSDGDGLADHQECPNGYPCPDPDGDGIPEWIDFTCNGNWIPVISDLKNIIQICQGDSLSISANNYIPVPGNIIYTWTGPNNLILTDTTNAAGPFKLFLPYLDEKFEGYYSLTLLSEKGCKSAPQQVYVNYGQVPATPFIAAEVNPLCQGEPLILNSTPVSGTEIKYIWYLQDSTGQSSKLKETDNPTILIQKPDNGSSYFVEISSDGCISNGSNIIVPEIQSGGVNLNDEFFTLENNPGIRQFNVISNDIFIGSPNIYFTEIPANIKILNVINGLVSIDFPSSSEGLYQFKYTMCSTLCPDYCDTATLKVFVKPVDLVPKDSICDFPNVFTPNDDGENDNFQINCLDVYKDNHLQVFNRWGDIVYEKESYQNEWKGTYKNNPLPAGTYFYILKLNELKKTFTGFITLVR